MSLSPVPQADRKSRNRAALMVIGAVALLVLALLSIFDIPHGTASFARVAIWVALILLWLLVLATGGGFMLNRRVRSMMNDEVSAHNRRRAIETGFWIAMVLAIGLYYASFARPIPLRAGLGLLTEIAIAAALLRYAWLDLS